MSPKKKIVLFYPIATNFKQGPPYSLLFLERMVRDVEVEVAIFDEKHDKGLFEFIKINQEDIILLGISVMLSNQIISARIVAEFTKTHTNIPVLYGGWFPTTFPEIVLSEEFIDFIIVKQGEIPFRELILKLQSDNNDYETIKGLGFKKEGSLILNEENKWANIFEFPRVDFNKIDITKYLENGNLIQYIASQGCNCQCNFCTFSIIKDIRHLTNKPENIIEDIVSLKNKIPGLTHISFIDDNFFSNRHFVMQLCNLFIEHKINITWNGSAHIKQFLTFYNEDDIKFIKKSGCIMIWCGAESADDSVLKKINKNYKKNDTINILRIFKRNQISASFNFMVAFPINPQIDFKRTLKFIMKILLLNRNLEIAVNFYMPFTKNEYYYEARKLGFSLPNSYKEFENVIMNGSEMNWVTPEMKRQIGYLGEFYLPILKLKYPLNTQDVLKQKWNLLFAIFYPLIYLRFATRFYRLNIDAYLGLKYLNYFRKKKGIEVSNLNNFMTGFDRYVDE